MKEKDQLMLSVGTIVRKKRRNNKISQKTLSVSMQISRNYVSDIERGVYQLTFYMVIRLAISLNVKPRKLIEEILLDYEKNIV